MNDLREAIIAAHQHKKVWKACFIEFDVHHSSLVKSFRQLPIITGVAIPACGQTIKQTSVAKAQALQA